MPDISDVMMILKLALIVAVVLAPILFLYARDFGWRETLVDWSVGAGGGAYIVASVYGLLWLTALL